MLVALGGRDLPVLGVDPGDYARHAHSIAAGNGYPDTFIAAPGSPTAMRPPALPYLLGGVEWLTGSPNLAPLLAQAVLGTVAVALIWWVARELFGPQAGLAAGATAAVFPPLVLMGAAPLSEALFIPLELAVVAAVLVARRAAAPPLALALAAGALCGLAALTRQAGLFLLLPVVAGLFTVRAWPRRRSLLASALAVLATVVVVAPWTLRNHDEFDRFIPVALQDGLLFAGTYNEVSGDDDDAPGAWRPVTAVPELRPLFFRPGIDEAELNDRLSEHGRDYLRDHPAYLLTTSGFNTLRLFGVGPGSAATNESAYLEMGVESGLLEDLARVAAVVLGLLALAGAALLLARRQGPLFVWLAPLILFATTVPIIGSPRYRTVLDPFLILLAAGGLARFRND